jgi:hypothetical protein
VASGSSSDVDEQIRAWMEARGWKVTAVNYDAGREVYAWRHDQRGGNSPTLRITRAVLEDYPAFALMEHIARLRVADAIRREPGATFLVAEQGDKVVLARF